MKAQRKLLTKEQRQLICEKHSRIDYEDGLRYCNLDCPLREYISDGTGRTMDRSCKQISIIEKSIKVYWDKEIEVTE